MFPHHHTSSPSHLLTITPPYHHILTITPPHHTLTTHPHHHTSSPSHLLTITPHHTLTTHPHHHTSSPHPHHTPSPGSAGPGGVEAEQESDGAASVWDWTPSQDGPHPHPELGQGKEWVSTSATNSHATTYWFLSFLSPPPPFLPSLLLSLSLLPPVFLLPFHYSFYFDSVDSHPQSAAMPAPTLEFAAICLQNALFLLPPMSVFLASVALTPIEEGEGSHRPPSIPALPGPPIQGQDIISLR